MLDFFLKYLACEFVVDQIKEIVKPEEESRSDEELIDDFIDSIAPEEYPHDP
jgi:hypothetical protein